MDDADWRRIAIRNNMDWHTAQAQSWQLPFNTDAYNWWTLQPVPPYHSHLVAGGTQPDALIAHIDQALNQEQAGAGWSIKDANGIYNLQSSDFAVLFDAQWLARRPAEAIGRLDVDCTHVRRVRNTADFHRWVAAWGETPPGTQIFVPQLLDNPTVQLLYVERGGVMTGGLALNRSEGAVGVSNWFGAQADINCCMAYAANRFTDIGVVGYEREPDKVRTLAGLGFDVVGDLRVWIK